MAYETQYKPLAAAITNRFPEKMKAKAFRGQAVTEAECARSHDLLWAITLEKEAGVPYKILNLTDMHFSDTGERYGMAKDAMKTMAALIYETAPDLITVTGDIVCGDGTYHSIRRFTDFMESFDIPWAPVFGNHDDEANCDRLYLADIMRRGPHCLMQKGDAALGIGNYVINITEGARVALTLFMTDSRGGLVSAEQMAWVKSVCDQLKAEYGDCAPEAAVFLHIPTAEYEAAYNAAFDPDTAAFRDGFGAIGEKHEAVCCHRVDGVPYEEGFFRTLKETGLVRHIFCGHEHMNNFSIVWDGIRLTYTMKVGKGSGYQPGFDGGTLITVDGGGISRITHKTRRDDTGYDLRDIADCKLHGV